MDKYFEWIDRLIHAFNLIWPKIMNMDSFIWAKHYNKGKTQSCTHHGAYEYSYFEFYVYSRDLSFENVQSHRKFKLQPPYIMYYFLSDELSSQNKRHFNVKSIGKEYQPHTKKEMHTNVNSKKKVNSVSLFLTQKTWTHLLLYIQSNKFHFPNSIH